MDRRGIADHIVARLDPLLDRLSAEFQADDRIRSCRITGLLPAELAQAIHRCFPPSDRMMLKRSIKENKHVAAHMDAYEPDRKLG